MGGVKILDMSASREQAPMKMKNGGRSNRTVSLQELESTEVQHESNKKGRKGREHPAIKGTRVICNLSESSAEPSIA